MVSPDPHVDLSELWDTLRSDEGVAFLHRPSVDPDHVSFTRGTAHAFSSMAQLQHLAEQPGTDRCREIVAALPYRVMAERGFDVPDDGCPILAIESSEPAVVPLSELLDSPLQLPAASVSGFDQSDEAFAQRVERVIVDDISAGKGSNFVLHRTLCGHLGTGELSAMVAIFTNLLRAESGAYWTFLIATPLQILIGASPELHLRLKDGLAHLNPISGTLRHPDGPPSDQALVDFVNDDKEASELAMVVDEELKIMTRICAGPISVQGPGLKHMANLTHSEYHLSGRRSVDPWTALTESLFCPTVVGSPIQSAARVITEHEPDGRGYYAGAVVRVSTDPGGEIDLDSAITIRCAEVEPDGALRLRVGSTVVRSSTGEGEAKETAAKAFGVLGGLGLGGPVRRSAPSVAHGAVEGRPSVIAALALRNVSLSRHWFPVPQATSMRGYSRYSGQTVLVIDAEDRFTSMVAHLLTSLGFRVTLQGTDGPLDDACYDLVVLGPGPGDPTCRDDERVNRLRQWWGRRLRSGRPTLGICLSHQVLARELGLEVARRSEPNQGRQLPVQLFGRDRRVGLYNSFVALAPPAWTPTRRVIRTRLAAVEIEAHPVSREVLALRGDGFASVQFHPESILTTNGPEIVEAIIDHLVSTAPALATATPSPASASPVTPSADLEHEPATIVSRCLDELVRSLDLGGGSLTERAVVSLALTHYGEDASLKRGLGGLAIDRAPDGFASQGGAAHAAGRPRSVAEQLLVGTALLVGAHRANDLSLQAQAVDLLNRSLALVSVASATGSDSGQASLVASLHAAAWARSVGESDVNVSQAYVHANALSEWAQLAERPLDLASLSRICIALHHASRVLEDDGFGRQAVRIFLASPTGRSALETPHAIARTADIALAHTAATLLGEEHPDLHALQSRSGERLHHRAAHGTLSASGHAAVVRALAPRVNSAPRVGDRLVM